MNWTLRRPFRHQFNSVGVGNKSRPLTFREHFDISNKPIDSIRLQSSDYDNCYNPCPIHNPHRNQSSLQRIRSSIHSISTVETDFVHQLVSTIDTYPSSPSIIERQQIIDEDNQNDLEINQSTNINTIQEQQKSNQSDQCRTCLMIIEIVDQQAQQIRQYAEQATQQADLIAKFTRRFAGIEEGIDDQKSEEQIIHEPTTK